MAARLTGPAPLAAALLGAALLVVACAPDRGGPIVTFPPTTFGTGLVTGATEATRANVARAVAPLGLRLGRPQAPYRPGESPLFEAAPRTVFEIELPGGSGAARTALLSIYEFANEDAATAAADEQARYVASPVGRVLFTTGTQFTIRRDGRAVVFYAWLPAEDEPLAREIADALGSVGIAVAVPS